MTLKNKRRALAGAGIGLAVSVAVAAFLFEFPMTTGAVAASGPAETPAVPVTVAVVESRDVTRWEQFSGRLEAVERVQIRSRVAGQIQAVHFREGALGKLATLSSPSTRPLIRQRLPVQKHRSPLRKRRSVLPEPSLSVGAGCRTIARSHRAILISARAIWRMPKRRLGRHAPHSPPLSSTSATPNFVLRFPAASASLKLL